MPRHVAIVMDGNGRWAAARGRPRSEGHVAGAWRVLEVANAALEIGLQELSVFAFSTENWQRGPDEVAGLLGVIAGMMRAEGPKLHQRGVCLRWVGRALDGWSNLTRQLMAIQELTANNTAFRLNVCVNYGGRAEITDAARKLANAVAAGEIHPAEIDDRRFESFLYWPDMRPVDLLIRSSGELRTSNFFLWQAAHAELLFTSTLWPDFGRREFEEAIDAFAGRERRLGGAPSELTAAGTP